MISYKITNFAALPETRLQNGLFFRYLLKSRQFVNFSFGALTYFHFIIRQDG
jgi:hypothetical protein